MINFADEKFYTDEYNIEGRKAVIDTAFAYFARLATQEIKRYTGSNVDEYNIPEAVSMCCCEVAELVYKNEQLAANSNGVSSESVGGWSKSFESSESRKLSFDNAVRDCVYKWLSGTGLLYRGIGKC